MVITHLQTQVTRHDPPARCRWKIRLSKRLHEHGYGRQDVLELFRFIDWLLVLPEELGRQFQQELAEYEAAMSTPYITSIERQGLEKGFRQGRERGQEEGELRSLRRTLKKLLSQRFGTLPERIEQQIEQAEQTQLDQWLEHVLEAPSLTALFPNA